MNGRYRINFNESTVLITGAAGGIGSAVARRLGSRGARLLLTDFRAEPLVALAAELEAAGVAVITVAADLGQQQARQRIAASAAELGVNVLINVAGINPFGLFAEQSDAEIERAIAINTLAPLLLSRALLPVLAEAGAAHIVNVGSVFGSLGYPGFAVYSASKFAVRGFSEALRRELADTAIRIHYVAPRATRTALSTDRISAMNAELKVATDVPDTVAAAIETALTRSRREVYLGLPERMFRLLNALLPALIDRALARQLAIVKRYATCAEGHPQRAADPVNLKILGVRQ
jgi:short-subunit dehydrogenase